MMRQKCTLLFICFLICLSPLSATAASPADSDLANAAQKAVETAMEYGGAISGQYALWMDGKLFLQGTAGDPAVTDQTQYGIGSISKTFTATAVMTLVEAGKIDLDRPVTDYLPDFQMTDPRYSAITVRMLLNHASGLMGGTIFNGFLLGDPTDETALDHFLDELSIQTLQADPGAYSVYSNDSYTLAQLVIERVSGMSYESYLRQAITGPLGLTTTLAPMEVLEEASTAATYLPDSTQVLPMETVSILGAGGLYSTASDLATFGGALCQEGLLSSTSLEAMATNEALSGMWPADSSGDALAYGLGWDCVNMFPFCQSGIQALVKGGDTLVYHAGLVVLPEYDMAAAVLTSGGASTYNEAAAARMLIDALAAQGVTVDERTILPASAEATMPSALAAYSGFYGSSTLVVHVSISNDGIMTITTPAALHNAVTTLTYRADGSFQDEANSLQIRLIPESNGQIYLYQKGYTPLPGLVPLCTASYAYERLPENPVSEEVLAAWRTYAQPRFYVQLNEKYTSALYPFQGVFASISLEETESGYVGSNQIVDEHTAIPFVQIPGIGSRDSAVITAYTSDDTSYLSISGAVYQDSASLLPIYNGPARCTIRNDGYARWYAVGEAAGNTMTVTLPQAGGFVVYNAFLQPVAASWALGDTNAVLPEGGWIVFAGDPGSVFRIEMTTAENSLS